MTYRWPSIVAQVIVEFFVVIIFDSVPETHGPARDQRYQDLHGNSFESIKMELFVNMRVLPLKDSEVMTQSIQDPAFTNLKETCGDDVRVGTLPTADEAGQEGQE